MNDPVIIASKKRIALAIYIDFILFTSVWRLGEHFLLSDNSPPFWAMYASFGVFEFLMYMLKASPGSYAFGIDKNREVDRAIFKKGNWVTMLIGVLFLLEGTKLLARWTQIFVPLPFFGFIPGPSAHIAINMVFGLILIITGFLFLRLKLPGLVLGLVYSVVTIVSVALSWSLWNQIAIQMVEARRAFQGMPVREGEIEFMQRVMPEFIVVYTAILLIAMLFTVKRFSAKEAEN